MEIRSRHWLVALVLAGLCHAALVMALTSRPVPPALAVPITIDLGPPGGVGGGAAGAEPPLAEVAAPVEAPAQEATALEPVAPEPVVETLETVEAQEIEPPTPTVARTLPKPKPKPKPVKKKTTPKPATKAVAKAPPRRSAPAASAGDGQVGRGGSGARGGRGAGGGSGSAATGNYYGTLAAWLNRHKRYPSHARRRHQEGTVKVVFTIDRQGHLLSHRILESSGYPLLDEEVKAMLRRAAPLPAMPAEIRQAELTITVPINFTLR